MKRVKNVRRKMGEYADNDSETLVGTADGMAKQEYTPLPMGTMTELFNKSGVLNNQAGLSYIPVERRG